jgi:hypothetical protein
MFSPAEHSWTLSASSEEMIVVVPLVSGTEQAFSLLGSPCNVNDWNERR